MWARCIACHSKFPRNRFLSAFPIGSRFAFDPVRGRLWVICSSCGRWNLAPFEERWEAVETLEELFQNSRSRVSSGEVSLARVNGSNDLIRIGDPPRSELAAWRYVRQFRRRRGVALASGAAAVGLGVGVPLAGLPLGSLVGVGLFLAPWFLIGWPRAITRGPSGEPRYITPGEFRRTWMPADTTEWCVEVEDRELDGPARLFEQYARQYGPIVERYVLRGEDALSFLRLALPALNRNGAPAKRVRLAVDHIEAAGTAAAYLDEFRTHDHSYHLRALPRSVLLAFEMALFEEDERRALAGEIDRIRDAWVEAEELAAIVDELIPPVGWDDFRARVLSDTQWRPTS